jgi:hypothetical protein
VKIASQAVSRIPKAVRHVFREVFETRGAYAVNQEMA